MKRITKILDEFGRPIVVDIAPRPSARYDAASTSSENKKHWGQADALSARAANSPGVRRTLRNRSRYERDNDPYYGGLVRTIPADTFGTGANLQIMTDRDDWNVSIEQKFGSWANAVGLTQGLLTAHQAKIVDGEPFGLLRKWDVKGEPVPLDVQWIESEQCQTPRNFAPKNLALWVDGLDLDERGRVIGYHILHEHPGDSFVIEQKFDRLPADLVLHWFRKDRPAQYRGVPECTASLPVGAQRRRWAQATLVAAELAADFAVLVTSNLPNDFTEDDVPAAWEYMEVERGMITTLPAGGDAKQMRTEHPGTEYSPFKHELLKEMGRPVGAPYSITGLDGSEHNYSSLRYEREIYHAALRVEREAARWTVLDPIFKAWYAMARLIPGYLAPIGEELPETILFGWYWPGFPAIDPLKEAAADTERLENGTTTLQELFAEYGQDWRVMLAQRAREIKFMKENNIPLPMWADPAAASKPSTAPAGSMDRTARLALLREESA